MDEKMAIEFLQKTPKWALIDEASRIRRRFVFENFKDSLDFVNKIGKIAELEGHHPDITFGWGYVEVVVNSHKIGGLHDNDFILAAKINNIAT